MVDRTLTARVPESGRRRVWHANSEAAATASIVNFPGSGTSVAPVLLVVPLIRLAPVLPVPGAPNRAEGQRVNLRRLFPRRDRNVDDEPINGDVFPGEQLEILVAGVLTVLHHEQTARKER
jgi:hypothetical protein